jgi:hypothetical protein
MCIMKMIVVLLLFAFQQWCFGTTNLNTIAVGDWSQIVGSTPPGDGSLRGRLLILEGYSPGYEGKTPETLVYLELQNVSIYDTEVYYDFQKGLNCELRDSHNQPPPPTGSGGNGGHPSANWITLPKDSTIRLRASWYGYGMPKEEGLMIPLYRPIIVKAGNTNDYFLTGTFTVTPPTNHIHPPDHRIWQGTLSLPKMKISSRRP